MGSSPLSDPPVTPPQARYVVWFDWATASLMCGLAFGQVAWAVGSRADLAFQMAMIPLLFALGEGLRRRSGWAWVVQLIVSAALSTPLILALIAVAGPPGPRARVNPVIAGVLVVAAGAALQLGLLLLPSTRRWLWDPRPHRLRAWPLLALALPALAAGLALESRLAAQGWRVRAAGALGIRVRMPADAAEQVSRREDPLGGPFLVHDLAGTAGACSYVVSCGRLPPPRDGRPRDAAAWRGEVLQRMAEGVEVRSRTPVLLAGVEGEELRFRRDGLEHTFRVLSSPPRFVVMGRTCRRAGALWGGDGFFESLTLEPW